MTARPVALTDKALDIPTPVLRRLAKYRTYVLSHPQDSSAWLSSILIARSLGLTPSTVRQDLMHIDICGTANRGYNTGQLLAALERTLCMASPRRVAIVGAGNLGQALVTHGQLARHGFVVRALFDKDPRVVGRKIADLAVLPISAALKVVTDLDIEIGVLAVPEQAGQSAADLMVVSGVRGILNLTACHIRVPSGIEVVNADLLASFCELSSRVPRKSGAHAAPAGPVSD